MTAVELEMDPHEQHRQAIQRASALMREHLIELGYLPDGAGYSIPEDAVRQAAEYAKSHAPDALSKSVVDDFAERVIHEIREHGKQHEHALEMGP